MIFKNKKVFLPVIHVENTENTYKNIEIALKAKADGVFLISHGFKDKDKLVNLAKDVKDVYPNLWIGVNFLDIESREVFKYLEDKKFYPDGVWIDNSYHGFALKEKLKNILLKNWSSYKDSGFNGLYFGGIAFKYLEQPKDLPETIKTAKGMVDVITTSGDGTGKSADISKIKTIYDNNVDNLPIAIASGIDASNISNYLPYVDMFFVSTGISKSDDEFDEEKVIELSGLIHGEQNES